jgi:hypothetical protein
VPDGLTLHIPAAPLVGILIFVISIGAVMHFARRYGPELALRLAETLFRRRRGAGRGDRDPVPAARATAPQHQRP